MDKLTAELAARSEIKYNCPAMVTDTDIHRIEIVVGMKKRVQMCDSCANIRHEVLNVQIQSTSFF